MSVRAMYSFECDGCFSTATGEERTVVREFSSVSGRNYGIGRYRIIKPGLDPPEGWIAFDPYTGCCYCQDCWASIVNPDDAESVSQGAKDIMGEAQHPSSVGRKVGR